MEKEKAFTTVIERCMIALDASDPQASVEAVLLDAAKDPVVADAISNRTKFASLVDLAIHRSDRLTLLAGALPPGFSAGPHNHNLWSVVSVCAGQEDNWFFERDGDGLKRTGEASVVAPGVLSNDADVIHAIRNALDTPLLVLHAYGGDLRNTAKQLGRRDAQGDPLRLGKGTIEIVDEADRVEDIAFGAAQRRLTRAWS